MKNFSDKFVEKIKTHFSGLEIFLENLAFYEKMWKTFL